MTESAEYPALPMRILIVLLLFAPMALAGGILVPRGATLGQFEVLLNTTKVDRKTPESLGRSWADLQVEEFQVAARFTALFKKAHIEILERTYVPALVELQKKAYAADIEAVNDLRCQYVKMDKNEAGETRAIVRRSWTDSLGRPKSDRAILTLRIAKDSAWCIARIAFLEPSGALRQNPRKVPPPTFTYKVPKEIGKFESTPLGTFKRLQREFRKLRFERTNAQHQLNRHVFELMEALYGTEVAQFEIKNRPAGKPRQEFFFRERDEETLENGRIRLAIMALEKAPDKPDAAIAVGEACFDMEKGKNGLWWVAAEFLRPDHEGALEPVEKKLGIFLMG